MANIMEKRMNGKLKRSVVLTALSALFSGTAIFSVSAVVSANTSAKPHIQLSQTELASANRLNALLGKTQSLKAAFVQTTTTKKPKTGQPKQPQHLLASSLNKNFSGVMMVERPNKFRWETKQPSQQLIVADSKTLWIYDPDLEQATQQRVDKQVANTPALLLSGSPKKIMQSFRVTQPNPKKDVFVLYPKTEDAVFETLAIAFIDGKPRSMVLNDALGQVTTIKFTKISQNPRFNASLFDFVPPKGVDVIYQ